MKTMQKSVACLSIMFLCSTCFGQASIESAVNTYQKAKADLMKPVLDAFDAEIEAARVKGDAVKAKRLSIEKEAFMRQEEPPSKLEINEAIGEFQKRLKDSEGLESSVQRSKIIDECIDWLKKNVSRRQVKLVFRVLDVEPDRGGLYRVYLSSLETALGENVEVRNPRYYLVKLSEKQAEKVGIDHRVVISGIPEVGEIDLGSANYPVFYVEDSVRFDETSLKLAIYLKEPTVRVIEK